MRFESCGVLGFLGLHDGLRWRALLSAAHHWAFGRLSRLALARSKGSCMINVALWGFLRRDHLLNRRSAKIGTSGRLSNGQVQLFILIVKLRDVQLSVWRSLLFGSRAYVLGELLQRVLILILGLGLIDNFVAFDARRVLAGIPYEPEAGIRTLYFPWHVLQLRL